jgi:hypothetical protein
MCCFTQSENIYSQTKQILEDSNIVTFSINLNAINNDATKNSLSKILAQFSNEKSFNKEHIVKPGETLNLIIKREYGLISEKFNGTYLKFERMLKGINNISSSKIFPFQKLQIPEAPNISTRNATDSLIQIYNITNLTSDVAKSDSFYLSDKKIRVDDTNKKIASLVNYNLSIKDYTALINKFSDKLLDSLKNGALLVKVGNGDMKVAFSDSSDKRGIAVLPENLVDSEMIDLSSLDKSYFDTLILIDYFYKNKDTCGHGKKVFTVIENIFHIYNLDPIIKNVRIIPINFYQNKKDAKILLQTFSNDPAFQREEDVLIQKSIKKLINDLANDKIVETNCPDCVPEIYFNALMKLFYSYSPDIISTSFWVNAIESPVPNYTLQSKTNLITAGSDNINSFIETLAEKKILEEGRLQTTVQPIRSYFDSRKYGCVIVGCEKSPGDFYGMSSKDGFGVTVIGKGYNWQNVSCLESSDLGTSFSTPEISAKLFIAKAFWRSIGFNGMNEITAQDAGKVLALSSIIHKNYVGKFASAGRISLKKLLHPSGVYIVDNAANIIKVDSVTDGEIDYYDFKNRFRKHPLKYSEYWGIYYLDNNFYAYDDELYPRWFPIKVMSFSIKYYINGVSYTLSSIEHFTKQFFQLIMLKN